jgi:hypothetical protein
MSEILRQENLKLRQMIESQKLLIFKLELIKDKFRAYVNECNCDQRLKSGENNAKQEINRLIDEYNEFKANQNQSQSQTNADKSDRKIVFIKNEDKSLINSFNNNNNNNKFEINRKADNNSVNKKLNKSDIKIGGSGRFPCSWPGCESKFAAKYLLKYHLLSHTGEKPYTCDWPGCEKRYASRSHLNHHRVYHSDDRRYKCLWPGCEDKFIRKEALDKHVCEAHTVSIDISLLLLILKFKL